MCTRGHRLLSQMRLTTLACTYEPLLIELISMMLSWKLLMCLHDRWICNNQYSCGKRKGFFVGKNEEEEI